MELELFKAGKDWENNACIETGGNQHYKYSLGYKEAADLLSNNAADTNAQDLFIYPIAFLYRHHLELQLKIIIQQGNLLINGNAVFPSGHDLKRLWGSAKEISINLGGMSFW